jgi:hypothetical protein
MIFLRKKKCIPRNTRYAFLAFALSWPMVCIIELENIGPCPSICLLVVNCIDYARDRRIYINADIFIDEPLSKSESIISFPVKCTQLRKWRNFFLGHSLFLQLFHKVCNCGLLSWPVSDRLGWISLIGIIIHRPPIKVPVGQRVVAAGGNDIHGEFPLSIR